MAKVEHVLAGMSRTTPAGGLPPSSAVPTIGPINRTKLPKLILKPFNGNLTGWSPFWDMSKTAVHDNTHFSNIEKSIFTIIVDRQGPRGHCRHVIDRCQLYSSH